MMSFPCKLCEGPTSKSYREDNWVCESCAALTGQPEQLLAQFLEAMKHVDDFEKASTWNESKWDTPPLVPANQKEVDPEAFKAFDRILYFLTLAVFGVDEEGRSRGRLVEYALKDTTRDIADLPFWVVPKPREDKLDLRKLLAARRSAENNVRSAQKVVERVNHELDFYYEHLFKVEDFKNRAKDCKTCEGKGYVKYTKEAWDALKKAAWHTNEGEDHKLFFKRAGRAITELYGIPFRAVACTTCQTDEDLRIR